MNWKNGRTDSIWVTNVNAS